ncbi:MAG: sulfatase [Akkermansiaceae bacterium]|nr:sulfatase [Akkermansiaceae bacterium]
MNRLPFVVLLAAGLGLAAEALASAPKAVRPNIIVLLADDLGWHDLGCTGSPDYRTPRIDRLAAEGMRFTEGHAAAPICSASRAALLTGRSPARLRYEFVPKFEAGRPQGPQPLQPPDFPTELPAELPTVATQLRAAGYATAFFGKWHLNRHQAHYLGWRPGHGPESFGFGHCVDDFGAHPYGYGGKKPDPVAGDAFPKDSLTAAAVDYLRQPRDKPFLLWMSFYHVHDPFHSPCADRVAWHRSRLPAAASPKRAHYAAMVETLDHEVGLLLTALDDAGLAENTLVIFTSDNGGHPEVSANGPLRGSKWNLYQGGLRVPLAVRWPGRVAPGSSCKVPVVGMDLAATILAAAGLPQDIALDGKSLLPCLEGKEDPSWSGRPLLWHFPYYQPETRFEQAKADIGVGDFAIARSYPHAALRTGNLKLIHFFESGAAELYDLAKDPSEQHDLTASRSEDAARMQRQLLNALEAVDARLPVRKSP